MKKIRIIIALAVCALTISAISTTSAQNFFPTTKGAELIYNYYNAKGKPLKDEWKDLRRMRFVVEDTGKFDGGTVVNVAIDNETIDRLPQNKMLKQVAKDLSYGDVKIGEKSVTFDNMQWLVDVVPEMIAYLNHNVDFGFTYRVELSAMTTFPKNMTVGSSLPDEEILNIKYFKVFTEEQKAERERELDEIEIETGQRFVDNDYPVESMTARIRNRKVEAFEKVKTPAGTFDCYKVTYELLKPNRLGIAFFQSLAESDSPDEEMIRQARYEVIVKCVDWLSPDAGFVKREIYNEKGKLQEIMLLESYKK